MSDQLKCLDLWFWLAVGGLFFLLCMTYLMRPIMEPDFFWHLKTGEWIWQHRELPSFDPFSFTGPQQPDARQLVTLQGYWLAQIGYHAAVASCGLWGIFVLRVALLAAFFGLFLWMFERHRVNRLLSLALLSLFTVFFLENYALERPQVYTFLAIGLLVICYRWARERFRTERSVAPPLIAVFLLVTAWGNLHGGVLLGQGAIALMALTECAVFFKGKDRRRFLLMLIFLSAAFAGSLLAPAASPLEMLSLAGAGSESIGAAQSQTNYEYRSVFTWLFDKKNYKLLMPIALSLTCALVIKEAMRRGNYIEMVLLALFWIFAYRYVRYLPIAMVFSLLFIAWNYRPDDLLRYCSIPLLIGAALSAGLWTSNEFSHLSKAREVGLIDPLVMPQQAADFLQGQQFKGRILNPINWGGYLMWRLGPDVQVAADGRVLDLSAYREISRLSRGEGGESAHPLWQEYVDRHKINVAIIPLMTGPRPSQLAQEFSRSLNWRMIYQDQVSAIFIRRVPIGEA